MNHAKIDSRGIIKIVGDRLTEDEVEEYHARALSGCAESRERLILDMIPIASSLAFRWSRGSKDVSCEELESIAFEAVIREVDTPKKGNKNLRAHVRVRVWSMLNDNRKHRHSSANIHAICGDDDVDLARFESKSERPEDPVVKRDMMQRVMLIVAKHKCRPHKTKKTKHWDYLISYYGLDGSPPASPSEIAKANGIDIKSVKRIVNRAIYVLREELNVA